MKIHHIKIKNNQIGKVNLKILFNSEIEINLKENNSYVILKVCFIKLKVLAIIILHNFVYNIYILYI